MAQITQKQTRGLLEVLSEFKFLPRPGLDLAATLAANSQRAQLEAARRFSVTLSLDESGVKALGGLLTSFHHTMLPGRFARLIGARISLDSSLLIANTFGAFLGEALRARLGGEWRLIDTNGQKLVALWFSDGNWVLPTYKAGKHFMNGPEDDVRFFYQVVVQKRSPGAIRPLLTISSDDLKDPDYARKINERLAQALKEKGCKADV